MSRPILGFAVHSFEHQQRHHQPDRFIRSSFLALEPLKSTIELFYSTSVEHARHRTHMNKKYLPRNDEKSTKPVKLCTASIGRGEKLRSSSILPYREQLNAVHLWYCRNTGPTGDKTQQRRSRKIA
jgi:hypothetical protein